MCQLGPSGLYVPQAHMHVHSMTRAVCAEEARHTESVRCHMEGASLAYKHYTIHVEKLEQARARAIHGDATVVTEIYIYMMPSGSDCVKSSSERIGHGR